MSTFKKVTYNPVIEYFWCRGKLDDICLNDHSPLRSRDAQMYIHTKESFLKQTSKKKVNTVRRKSITVNSLKECCSLLYNITKGDYSWNLIYNSANNSYLTYTQYKLFITPTGDLFHTSCSISISWHANAREHDF